jgi:hypothetical protein
VPAPSAEAGRSATSCPARKASRGQRVHSPTFRVARIGKVVAQLAHVGMVRQISKPSKQDGVEGGEEAASERSDGGPPASGTVGVNGTGLTR